VGLFPLERIRKETQKESELMMRQKPDISSFNVRVMKYMRNNPDILLTNRMIFDNCRINETFSHERIRHAIGKAKAMMTSDEHVLTKYKLGHIYHNNNKKV